MPRELRIKNRNEFLRYLDSVSKINDSAIFDITPSGISCLVASIDNTLIQLSEYKDTFDFTSTLNIPDIKKFQRVIDTLNTEEVVLSVGTNCLEYKGSDVKFKYHLFEEGFLGKPSLNVDKIKSFKYDVSFDFTRDVLQSLLKGSTFASETNKVYMYTEDGKVKADLTDRARHNTDNYSITITDCDFDLKPTPINFDNIRLISNIDNKYSCNINTEYGVVVIDNNTDAIKLKYIISSLTQ
jgi:hypothetical protein